MRKTFLAIAIILSATFIHAQVSQEWLQTHAGERLAPWNKGIATDNSGNVYVAGEYYNGSGQFMLLRKYDAAGTPLWTENYLPAGSTSAEARAMVIDGNGDLIISGVINNSSNIGFTRKYDPNGQLLWSQPTTFENFSLTTDEFNNVYVTSWDFTQDSVRINKYDGAGNLLWKVTNIPSSSGGHGKLFYKDGFLYRTGGTWMRMNARNIPVVYTTKYNASTGAQVWAKTWYHADKIAQGGWDLVVDATGNVYVSGTVHIKAGKNVNTNWFTLKYNSVGTVQWVTYYDGNGNDYYNPATNASTGFDSPDAITMDISGNIIVTGKSYTTTGQFTSHDMTTIKYNPAGSAVWVRTFDGPAHGDDGARAITTDASSNVYITGNANATTIKYNSSGSLQWSMNYNGGSTSNVHVDTDGNVYAGGGITGSSLLIKYSQSTPLFAGKTINPVAEEMITPLKIYPNPVTNQLTIENSPGKLLGTVVITNALGETVYRDFVNNPAVTIDVTRFSSGVYYLRTGQSVTAIKFLKK